jgi:phage terminase small subunit
VRVVSECCRHCHGTGHAFQWVDLSEYLAALDAAEAKNEARRAERKRPRPLPSDEGGYGFEPNSEPAEDCPRCYGRGTQRVVVTDTDRLSASARALLKGVRQKSTGEVEVLFHDQLTASDQLNRMQGAYIERSESRTLTVHATLPAPRDVSAEDLLALWRDTRS